MYLKDHLIELGPVWRQSKSEVPCDLADALYNVHDPHLRGRLVPANDGMVGYM